MADAPVAPPPAAGQAPHGPAAQRQREARGRVQRRRRRPANHQDARPPVEAADRRPRFDLFNSGHGTSGMESPQDTFLEPAALFTDWTPRAGAGCPRSLAHLAARWWLRGTKKMPRLGGGRAGASLVRWCSVG